MAVVKKQAEIGIDVVSDGEMSKTSFLSYTDERLSGFITTTAPTDPSAAKTGGVQNYFIEMNEQLMRESVPYLKALTV